MITLDNKNIINAGGYGVYFLHDGIGVKALRRSYENYEICLKSNTFEKAKEEFSILKILENSGITPKPYAVTVVKFGGKYFAAILMQHIEGERADLYFNFDSCCTKEEDPKEFREVADKLVNKLLEYGIEYTDDHGENVIIGNDGKYYLIDFSPENLTIIE